MKIERIDHIVLTVADVEATCRFYAEVCGMEVVTFGEGRKALAFGQQKINLHEAGKEFEPKADRPVPGSADLCLIARGSLVEVIEHLEKCQIRLVAGPAKKDRSAGRDRVGLHSRCRYEPD